MNFESLGFGHHGPFVIAATNIHACTPANHFFPVPKHELRNTTPSNKILRNVLATSCFVSSAWRFKHAAERSMEGFYSQICQKAEAGTHGRKYTCPSWVSWREGRVVRGRISRNETG